MYNITQSSYSMWWFGIFFSWVALRFPFIDICYICFSKVYLILITLFYYTGIYIFWHLCSWLMAVGLVAGLLETKTNLHSQTKLKLESKEILIFQCLNFLLGSVPVKWFDYYQNLLVKLPNFSNTQKHKQRYLLKLR